MGIIMSVSNLSYTIKDNKVIDNISFSLEESSVNAALSSNNGGKTTLIELLSGILPHKSGKIVVNNIELSRDYFKDYIINVSTILEDVTEQFVCDTVMEEIKYPLLNLKINSSRINELFNEVVNLLSIKSLINKRISELSYFEKIKVLIAASIIHVPKVLFVDDILRFLTVDEKEHLIKLFNKISDEYGIAILFTTSDISNIITVPNIYVLNNGKFVMNDTFGSIIKNDNELSKMGIEIPIMVDLSRKLEFYKLIDKIYYDPDKVVDALWK